MESFRSESEKAVSVLLEKGADLKALDAYGRTALHYASDENFDSVKLLLDKGADINATDKAGDTPVSRAAQGDSINVVKLLVAKDASPDGIGKCALALLCDAVRENNVENVRNILQQGHFNIKNESRKQLKTALCVLKLANLPLDMRKEILSYLPEDVLTKEQARVLFNHGANLKKLVRHCPFAWFKSIYDNTYDNEKAQFLEKIIPVIVEFRLGKIKEYLSSYEIRQLHQIDPLIITMLDRNNVEQHRAAIEQNVRAAFIGERQDLVIKNHPQEGG